MMTPEPLQNLPLLREDLKIYPSIKTKDGFPSWTLYDPTNNKYYRIGWKEFEMLSRWHLQRPEQLIVAINNETTLTVSLKDVKALADFLTNNNLIHHDPNEVEKVFTSQKLKAKKSLISKFLANYLFFRVPLFKPDKFLNSTAFLVKPLMTKKTLYVLFGMLLLSLYLASRQWEEFKATFMYFFNMEGMFYYAIAITVIQVFHEFGHAYVANYYGCRIHTIGAAFIILWPTLYTDTTDAWRLDSRRKQVIINSAGMIVETFLAAIALLLWSFLDDGILRSICFFTATASLIMTLSINLNPLMRFDGYYLLADLWGIDNLQTCSFGLGKWKIREWLFRFGEPPPFSFPPRTTLLLIVYAYATWVYRFLLYLGIALLVYHLFFKIVGIIMMLIEILVLLVMPIWNELKVYYKMRAGIKVKKINTMAFVMVAVLVLLLVVPWQNTAYLPALIRFNNESTLYAPQEAILQAIYVKEGDIVQKDDLLAQLYSPELELEIKSIKLEIEIIQNKIRQDLQLLESLGDQVANKEQLASDMSKYDALMKKKNQLNITAPFSGKIVRVNDELLVNTWLERDTSLFEIVNQADTAIDAYVEEKELNNLKTDTIAVFTANDFSLHTEAKVKIIDKTSTRVLNKPYLASKFMGDIPVLVDSQNQIVPATSIFRLQFSPTEKQGIDRVTAGILRIKQRPISIATRIWRAANYIFIRETGF